MLKLSYRLLFFYVSGPRVFLEATGLAHAASQLRTPVERHRHSAPLSFAVPMPELFPPDFPASFPN